VISASHLTRQFGDRVAVEDLSLELRPGEIFGLLGPNGGGKTTTLRMLAGLIAPTSGTVVLDDEPVNRDTSARLRQRVGFLTETPGLWDQFSVRQNLLVYARLHGLPRPAQAVDDAMEQFGIHDRAHDAAATLSKGLRQRVALARAMIHQPQVILLDEPTSGLDPESARGVRDLIVRARANHRTVVLSTHNLDEVERIADRIAVLSTHLLALDTPEALRAGLFGRRLRVSVRGDATPYLATLRARGLTEVTLDRSDLVIRLASSGTPDDRFETPAIVRALVNEGAGIQSVTTEEPSLEDVYLQLMDGVRR
jgi:ABC-2 type transport system ATP-binding protein